MCQAPLLRRMATTAWQADLQNKVSVSKYTASEARWVFHWVLRTSSLKQKQLPSLCLGVGSITSKTLGRANLFSVYWQPECTFVRGVLPETWGDDLCQALATVPTKKKPCAVTVPPILCVPAVVGSWAARESEDACRLSVSGFKIIVEGPVGTPCLEKRSPDEAKLLKERLTFGTFHFIDVVQVLP